MCGAAYYRLSQVPTLQAPSLRAQGGNQGRLDNLLDALGGSFPARVGGSLNPVRRGGGCLLLVVAAVLVEVLHDVAPQLFHLGVGRFLRRADFRS